ncbi:MAG: EcsC family protein [Suipraeoptans sp.]
MKQIRNRYKSDWKKQVRNEERYLSKNINRKSSAIDGFLEDKVPEKLADTLERAFVKAFELVFTKGTGIIEKTYDKEAISQDYDNNRNALDEKKTKKTMKAFSKKVGNKSAINTAISGAAGLGMGVLGIGLPDIPIFVGLMLKNIYEIALNYGFTYEEPEEQYFILLIIRGALLSGDELLQTDQKINNYIDSKTHDDTLQNKQDQIKLTATTLSEELLYMKFLQGIPIVGVVGGISDTIYMNRVSGYAKLKYKRRFLKCAIIQEN